VSSTQMRLRRSAALATVAAAVLLVLAACSSAGTGGANQADASSGSCSGTPIKVVTFFSQSGPLAIFGNQVPDAAAAAEQAVNAKCSLGRPLQVTICDDQSTADGSLQCGRQAKADGDLAVIGLAEGPGGSDAGTTAAGLPAFFTTAGTSWDNTSPLSYPVVQPPLSIAAVVQAAKALGAKSLMFAAVDVPGAHIQEEVVAKAAAAEGIKLETNFFPLDTTDFGSVAAAIVSDKPGALTFLMPQGEQFVSSLLSVGFNIKKTPIILNEGILNPDQEQQLGSKIDGLYTIGAVVSASASANAGIKQMKAEYAAAGKTFSPTLSVYAVSEWEAIHGLAETIQSLSKTQIDHLTMASLTAAVKNHGTFNLPAFVPVNYSHTALNDPGLYGSTRVFSPYQFVLQYENGADHQVGAAQDITKPFTLP
jgi:ABC-type branched-subunit amino acid transport system substrate-binding protein